MSQVIHLLWEHLLADPVLSDNMLLASKSNNHIYKCFGFFKLMLTLCYSSKDWLHLILAGPLVDSTKYIYFLSAWWLRAILINHFSQFLWLNLPLYRSLGDWQVCPQPLEQHFFWAEHSLSRSQLSTQAAEKPPALSGGGQLPCFTANTDWRNSQLVTHSQCFLGNTRLKKQIRLD